MRVLVTGGAGRLGRSVVAGLVLRGHHVTSVDIAVCPFDPPVEGVVADLLDPFQREDVFTRTRPEAVLHLAGIAVPFSRPDADTVRVKVFVVLEALSAAIIHAARSAVAASCPTVYWYYSPTWTPRYLPWDEYHPVEPWHAYGLSKAIIEETVRCLARTSPSCVLSCV